MWRCAAGDAIDFPLKHGGIATQQADAVAEHIAARAGAPLDPKPYAPLLHGWLLTGAPTRWMRHDPRGGDGVGDVAYHRLWWPPGKVNGHFLTPYLAAEHTTVEYDPSPCPRPAQRGLIRAAHDR